MNSFIETAKLFKNTDTMLGEFEPGDSRWIGSAPTPRVPCIVFRLLMSY